MFYAPFVRKLSVRQQKRLTFLLACYIGGSLLLLVFVWSQHSTLSNRLETTGFAMGSLVQQTLYGADGQEASDDALQAITELENKISWRVDGSDIAQLNDEAGSVWTDVESRNHFPSSSLSRRSREIWRRLRSHRPAGLQAVEF